MNIEECPICFADMNEEEGILLLECCNKQIHLNCILNWCSTAGKPTTCILCNQINNFLVDTQNQNTTESINSQVENIIETPPQQILIIPTRVHFMICLSLLISFACGIKFIIIICNLS